MKLCYLAEATSIHAQKWLNYFADRGHQVDLISLSPGSDHDFPKVTRHLLRGGYGVWGIHHPMSLIQIKRRISRIGPDILHAHYVTDYGFWAALCGFHPLVVTAWGSDILIRPERSALARWKVTWSLRTADLLTCDATHIRNRMVDLGALKDKIELIYFGIDTRKFNPGRRDPQLKDELGWALDSLIIISLRNLSALYDVETLVKAAPSVLEAFPRARFLIVGEGEQRSHLENLAAGLGVSEWIRFTGRLPNEELPRYLASSDIYVSTSLSDAGLAASTGEAMACELPVVITDFGNNKDWVGEGEGGFLVPLRDPGALADRVKVLLESEERRRAFGRFNRAVIEDRNDYYKEMERMEDLYGQLLRGHRAAS